jgi:hypothetical protein
VSHWLIDLLVHRQDLTLAGRPPGMGFGLWNHPAIEIPLELLFAFGGLYWFVRRTVPVGKAGRWSPLVLAVGMAVLQAVNWLTPQPATVIDAPPSTGALGLLAYGVLCLLAWWVARTRQLA